jgi:DNA-binding CsgD family transcriptional regulator
MTPGEVNIAQIINQVLNGRLRKGIHIIINALHVPQMWEVLTNREKDILICLMHLEFSQEQTGVKHGLSKARIQGIKNEATNKLKDAVERMRIVGWVKIPSPPPKLSVLDTLDIMFLGMSAKTTRALRHNNIQTIGQLRRFPKSKLGLKPRLGPSNVRECEQALLEKCGIVLKD